jgi:hypothetical protein
VKKNVIITACDKKYGEFLIHDWLPSLTKTTNVSTIDIIVIDYGLTYQQRQLLQKSHVILKSGSSCTQHIVIKRYVDAYQILKNTTYNQVMLIDCGDIIFQKDISPLFTSHSDRIRVGYDADVLLYELMLPSSIPEDIKKQIRKTLIHKPQLNAGVVIAPKSLFLQLISDMNAILSISSQFGMDQVALNYILYTQSFELLPNTYNFLINPNLGKFFIKNGNFYHENGELISIVHNTGVHNSIRPIKYFGFGKEKNKINYVLHYPAFYWFSFLRYTKYFLSFLVVQKNQVQNFLHS